MKRIILATLAAAALAAPLSAQTALEVEVGQYVANPEALSTSQLATAKALIESDLSHSEIQNRIDAIID